MTLATGPVLVLVTWILVGFAVAVLGLIPALVCCTTRDGFRLLRYAIWWGVLVATTAVLLLSLWAPLRSPRAALAFGLLLLVAIGVAAVLISRRRMRWSAVHWNFGSAALAVTLLLAVGYFAVAALGPVTNYDSGLYHLGAIRYAADFGTVPGLANLYFPFGYGTSHFPNAAFLGNGPWGENGFRLLNGFLMTLAAVDLLLRLGERRKSPGVFVLAVGALAAIVPMVALSDYWVTSPSQDSAAFILTVVASAYLADAVQGHRGWMASAVTSIVIGLTITLIRPTLAPYLLGVVTVALALCWRRGSLRRLTRRSALPLLVVGTTAAISVAIRDRVLSGWLQYPASVASFDVPWRAAEPTMVRSATLGYHRDPQALWESIQGWAWIQPWILARFTQWETYEFGALLLTAGVLAIVLWREQRSARFLRPMLITMVPSLFAVIVWFLVTPPSYRFIWGPLFTIGTVALGWLLWQLTQNSTQNSGGRIWRSASSWAAVIAVPIAIVVAYSAIARLDASQMQSTGNFDLGIEIPYRYATVQAVPTEVYRTETNLTLLRPLESDQCWDVFPLCTPEAPADLRLIGQGIASGFTRE